MVTVRPERPQDYDAVPAYEPETRRLVTYAQAFEAVV